MVEPITNQEFLSDITKGIQSHGVYMMGVTDKMKDGDQLSMGYIYTIGHQERNRPDIVSVLYHRDTGEVTEEQVQRRFRAVQSLINSIVSNWDKYPLAPGHTAADELGILYRVFDESQFTKSFKEFTIQASNYYGREEYPLLIMLPQGYTH